MGDNFLSDADAAAMGRRIEQDVKAQRNYAFAFMQNAGAVPSALYPKDSGKKRLLDAMLLAVPRN